MDYWSKLSLTEYESYDAFLSRRGDLLSPGGKKPRFWFATTKAEQTYADVEFGPDDYIMFGKESAGIPEEILAPNKDACIRIPMWGDIRSLNLSNAVAVILYEALRQQDFAALEKKGSLHRLQWEEERKY